MNLWWGHINNVNNVTKLLIMRNTTIWGIGRGIVTGGSADKQVVADTV